MKLHALIAARPVFFFFLLVLLVLLFPGLLIPCWVKMTQRIQHDVGLNTYNLHSGMLSQIESVAEFLQPINSSATNLARVISSSVNASELSFPEIKTKVVPSLFQAFSTTPHMSQISYIALNGLFFSYYIDDNQTLAVYSNSSFSLNSTVPIARKKPMWYTQPVDRDTGKLYGEVIITSPSNVNTSWFSQALNSTDGSAALGTGWNKARDLLFLNTASIYGRGVVSLGFPVKSITNFFTGINFYGARLSIATNHGEVLVEGLPNTQMIIANNSITFQLKPNNSEQTSHIGYVSCMPGNGTISIGEMGYKVYCSPLEIAGVKSVYALAIPRKELVSLLHRTSKLALILLLLMIAIVVISVFSFVFIIVRAAKREMHVCASLIKQMEATQQAERKSMNKSLAFASASHDIRASLAGITGLIDMSYEEVYLGSELETNLKQMRVSADDLLSLLNSILDTSKIEAGKMQLEEKEFNLGQLLEDVVDPFHPVGMGKGVDVVLDPYDGSVMKFSHVKGDAGKLKQILNNLLSNAVKFTSEGHVTVRAWAQKPSSSRNPIHSSNQNGWFQSLSCLFYKNKKACNDLEAVNAAQKDKNSMEFVFEVDDTGKGIPKDKRKSVFENYIQVKEGEGGTGLGLGIVQSLVRLLGGDIEIVDKETDERGACFRFNVFLTICETSSSDNTNGGDNNSTSGDTGTQLPNLGLSICAPSPSLTIRTSSPRLSIVSQSPKLEGSRVVLLIGNEGRRRVAQNFVKSLGIKLSVVNRWENLHSTLRKLKSKLDKSPHSSLGKSDLSSRSDSSGTSLKDVPLSGMEGTDHMLPVHKRRGISSFTLLIIDATSGPFSELFKTVTEFRIDLQGYCKVVWLDKPTSRSINFDGLEEEMMDPRDDVLLKPLHGSRLLKVIQLLPEFGGGISPQGIPARQKRQLGKTPRNPSLSHSRAKSPRNDYSHHGKQVQQAKIQEVHSSSSENSRKEVISTAPPVQIHFSQMIINSLNQGQRHKQRETEQESGETSRQKPLSGKRILVAEDSAMLRRIAMFNLLHLGATVEICENGEEALQLVRSGLKDQQNHGGPPILPYDYILMDCEMPIMNGYEATRQIRKEEKQYGVHIPIIALTAHISGDAAKEIILAGMDIHLGKPLNRDQLLEAIGYINNK